jgi:hypothetical protein
MLRALLLLLLLANGLFYAWTRGAFAPGWPPPSHGEREPARLAAQLRPELVVVMSPGAANAALAAAAAASAAADAASRLACMEAGPFSEAEVAAAEAALLAAGLPAGSWQREQVERAGGWMVYFGRFADSDARRQKEEELRRLKLVVEPVKTPAELVPGLMLGRYESREAADAALAQITLRGVRTARVVALPSPPPQNWLRAERADPALQARLTALKPPAGAGFVPCAKAP